MRISLFSILGDLSGTSFLDLFAGTGVIGVEAASRGAEPVLLVEKDARKRSTIERNISFVQSGIELVLAPVERFLRNNTRSWDTIFLDPPFAFAEKKTILEAACAVPHLAPEGLSILHLHRAEAQQIEPAGLTLVDRRAYGQSVLLFYRRAEG